MASSSHFNTSGCPLAIGAEAFSNAGHPDSGARRGGSHELRFGDDDVGNRVGAICVSTANCVDVGRREAVPPGYDVLP